jgi:hypothetical protein
MREPWAWISQFVLNLSQGYNFWFQCEWFK